MERDEIILKLTLVFREVLKNDALILTDNLNANDVDNWDSLNHMVLVTEVETAFSIKFKLKDLNNMRNVGDLIELIQSKLQN